MKERIMRAVAQVRRRLADGWMAWETTDGPMWAKVKNAHQIMREPMSEDENDVVDYVLKEQRCDESSAS